VTVIAELHEVHLLELPVGLYASTQEHSEALRRELSLIAEQLRQRSETALPLRLIDLIGELNASYGGLAAEQEERLADAVADGETTIPDLTYHVPAEVGPAVMHLAEILDEADEYCRAGRHLLTLATAPDQVRFRRWFLGEFSRQLAGAAPTPWPEYR